MTKKPKYEIGGQAFHTKDDVLNHAKKIKEAQEDFEPISDEAALNFLGDLIARHPNAEEKIGCGIKSIVVSYNDEKGAREFQILRNNGSRDNFSPRKCIFQISPNADLHEACRDAVKDQITAYRIKTFTENSTPACPYRGITLTDENSHVDHTPPLTFEKLVKDWMNDLGLSRENVQLTDSGAMKILGDENQLQSWQDYHQRHAQLRLLSIAANLSESKLAAHHNHDAT